LGDRRSHYEPSVTGEEQDHAALDDHELYVPHFQRVSISGEDTSGVPLEDLERASRLIVQALQIRKRYMKISHQSFSATAARFLDPNKKQPHHDEKQTIEGNSPKCTQNRLI
jgi:AMP deaminase